jgi:hypothetical protein
MQRFTTVVVMVMTSLALAGCAGFLHCQWRTGDTAAADGPQYALRFIEADDEGWFWDRKQADDAMRLIRSKASERDTIVVTFVHGWHHSAECCDGNVEGFRNTLGTLHSSLGANFNLVGLYIGWRGQSLPMPLDYLTFWGRKGAAERVGQNDVKEFIARLQDLYAEYRPDARRPTRAAQSDPAVATPDHFLGLVTIGHSFGAQVLVKAVTGSLEDQLQRLNKSPAYLRDAQPATADPAQRFALSGIGDLIILINPAVEASQYHRLHMLSRGLNYSRLQTPLILTVSAENDSARHRFFTTGRVFGELFAGKPHKDNEVERTVERQALGVYRGHVTHQLIPTDNSVKLHETTIEGDARQCKNQQSCKSDWHKWREPPLTEKPDSLVPRDAKLAEFDFSKDRRSWLSGRIRKRTRLRCPTSPSSLRARVRRSSTITAASSRSHS